MGKNKHVISIQNMVRRMLAVCSLLLVLPSTSFAGYIPNDFTVDYVNGASLSFAIVGTELRSDEFYPTETEWYVDAIVNFDADGNNIELGQQSFLMSVYESDPTSTAGWDFYLAESGIIDGVELFLEASKSFIGYTINGVPEFPNFYDAVNPDMRLAITEVQDPAPVPEPSPLLLLLTGLLGLRTRKALRRNTVRN